MVSLSSPAASAQTFSLSFLSLLILYNSLDSLANSPSSRSPSAPLFFVSTSTSPLLSHHLLVPPLPILFLFISTSFLSHRLLVLLFSLSPHLSHTPPPLPLLFLSISTSPLTHHLLVPPFLSISTSPLSHHLPVPPLPPFLPRRLQRMAVYTDAVCWRFLPVKKTFFLPLSPTLMAPPAWSFALGAASLYKHVNCLFTIL